MNRKLFDVLDLLVPSLSPASPLVRRETALGVVDEFRFEDLVVATRYPVQPAHLALFGDRIENLSSWTFLSFAPSARLAAEDDFTWPRYVALLRQVLHFQEFWVVVAEADCDQHPLRHEVMTVAALTDRLDQLRTEPARDFAFVAYSASVWR